MAAIPYPWRMDLVSAYKSRCNTHRLTEDGFQFQIVDELQSLADRLVSRRAPGSRRGLYLWGPVGRGKTMLMDLFYENLDVAVKRRVHFHAMMRWVRDRLAELSGRPNPLSTIAAELAPPQSVICIDEFHVSDVDNALVVELLLKELVSSRTVVVTTSNFSPDELVSDELGTEFRRNNPDSPTESSGLFRMSKHETQRLLSRSFRVLKIGGSIDYRTTNRASGARFFDSNARGTRQALARIFSQHADRETILAGPATVFGRPLDCVKRARGVYWFDYRAICEGNYSYRDYLELLGDGRLVILENVRIRSLDAAKRFGWLVEVVYDAGIALVVSAPDRIDRLLQQVDIPSHLRVEFQRIESRVVELCS